MDIKQKISALIGLNILSIIVILFFDFAATYYYQYKSYEISTYVFFGSGFVPTVALFGVMVFIGMVIYNLYKVNNVMNKKSNLKFVKKYYADAKKFSLYSGIILFVGALIFIAYEIFTDDWWWFEVAFYLPFATNIITYFVVGNFAVKDVISKKIAK